MKGVKYVPTLFKANAKMEGYAFKGSKTGNIVRREMPESITTSERPNRPTSSDIIKEQVVEKTPGLS